MGSSGSHPVPPDIFNDVKATTRFTRGEIEYLFHRFRDLCEQKGRTSFLTKRDFGYPSISIHNLIINEMFGLKTRIEFVDFAIFLHNFKPLDKNASAKEYELARRKKLKSALNMLDGFPSFKAVIFSMYDTDKDGNISRQDLLHIVYRLMSRYANMRTIVQIVGHVMEEMGQIKFNRITFEDFCVAFEPFDMEMIAIKFPSF